MTAGADRISPLGAGVHRALRAGRHLRQAARGESLRYNLPDRIDLRPLRRSVRTRATLAHRAQPAAVYPVPGLDPEVSNFGQPGDRAEHRRGAVPAESQLLLLDRPGVLTDDDHREAVCAWRSSSASSARGPADSTSTIPTAPDVIGENPTRSEVAATANGILIATRADMADWALDGGILGREAYRFDGSDPRFTSELMQGPLDPGERRLRRRPLGGGVRRHPDRERPAGGHRHGERAHGRGAERGQRFRAYAFRPTISCIVLDSHTPGLDPDRRRHRRHRAARRRSQQRRRRTPTSIALLDARRHGAAAGGAARSPSRCRRASPASTRRPRSSSSTGRCGRGWPSTAATSPARSTFLAASFLNPAPPLDRGVYMDFSAGPGDFANPLAIDPQNGENFGHPSLAPRRSSSRVAIRTCGS